MESLVFVNWWREMFFRTALVALPVTLLSIVVSPNASAVGIVVDRNYACESVADHELIYEELNNGNVHYEPDLTRCFVLRAGTRVGDAVASATDGRYVLVETADRGYLWTPSNALVAARSDDQPLGASPYSVARSTVAFAETIRNKFDQSLPSQGLELRLDELAALPSEIAEFDIGIAVSNGVFAVKGTLDLGSIPHPFEVHNGPRGKKYNLSLQAYLFSSDGRLIWEQSGHAEGDSWIGTDGAQKSFNLINAHDGDVNGKELMIIALGGPLSSEMGSTRTVLGAESLVISRTPRASNESDNLAHQSANAEDPASNRVASCLDEDRLARSFCRAAAEEADPFLRTALWDQYNEYNRILSFVERHRR